MSFEERVKRMLGERDYMIAVLEQHIEQLQLRIKELETVHPHFRIVDKPPEQAG
jgi:hypothetical protein